MKARLVILIEDGSEGRGFDISGDEAFIGRSEGDIVLAEDRFVSPRHARLSLREGKFFVKDLGSTNGVYVQLGAEQALEAGDLILLGLQVLQFHPVSEAESQVAGAVQHGTSLFGSKAHKRFARLEQRLTSGLVGDVYHLFRDETVIGREAGDLVFTADPFLSRRHATITRDPRGRFALKDLGSSNGTFLSIRNETEIKPGCRLRIGQHLFRLDSAPGMSSTATNLAHPTTGQARGGATS